ncbi:unnamed protein product [Rodentolepis nana]|uniref:Aspergillus nuclease S(1) n=1 Tax=Rodentolepis nana TaxID=102285 RepID=A0A0R3TZ36_RODNA|nr:unnamed protein product [Rodentolepis nana]
MNWWDADVVARIGVTKYCDEGVDEVDDDDDDDDEVADVRGMLENVGKFNKVHQQIDSPPTLAECEKNADRCIQMVKTRFDIRLRSLCANYLGSSSERITIK